MARKQAAAQPLDQAAPLANGLCEALVLRDVAAHGLRCGEVVSASTALLQQLAADGAADLHPDAIAHAKASCGQLVRVINP